MQQSSKSIARLTAALAKAQAELVNPEKTLVATIPPDGTGEAGKSFRYASLASGLEIVRKTLSQQAIAAIQTTAIDPGANIVKLTTVLAHSSGEWIASDWPVCAVAETANPQRMGAALTYARRYALFTMVGIAGEDDLDAPDLQAPTTQTADSHQSAASGNRHLNGGRRAARNAAVAPLAAEESGALRDRLLAKLAGLGSADDAASWAHQSLADKNRLRNDDAERVEQAFASKLTALGPQTSDAPTANEQTERSAAARYNHQLASRRQTKGIDKSILRLPEPRRIRDRDHVHSVAQQPCLVCGRSPCDAHHLRFVQSRALARKVSDEFTVPLCRGHHREVHRHGDEAAWWGKLGIDPTATARMLWLDTHPLPFDQGRTQPLANRAEEQKADEPSIKALARSNGHRQGRKRSRVVRKKRTIDQTKPFARTALP